METTMKSQLKTAYLLLMLFLLVICPTCLFAESWTLPLVVENGGGETDNVSFGIHPDGTDFLDTALGEINLPPLPPSAIFESRFLISGYEGFKIDIRDTTRSEKIYILKIQTGAGGYPIIVRWDSASLPSGAFKIMDFYGGVFIQPINMRAIDSLIIPTNLAYVDRLKIIVIPGEEPARAPALSQILDQSIFSGQRFPKIHLNDYVSDEDTPKDELQWTVTNYNPLELNLLTGNILKINYPEDWRGIVTTKIVVQDPTNLSDYQNVIFKVKQGGIVKWEIPLTVQNSKGIVNILNFGIHPEGTDYLDPQLGEINLPPSPPVNAFDSRFLIEGYNGFLRDIRENNDLTREHRLFFQPGEEGLPVTVKWDNSKIPPGEFFIQDNLGGTTIPKTNMKMINEIVISDSINTLLINVTPLIDTEPPIGPDNIFIEKDSVTSVTLTWESCIDANFHYYEIFYDKTYFTNIASYRWDFTDDSHLKSQDCIRTTITDLDNSHEYYFRIRAWDIFGNVGDFSNIVSTAVSILNCNQIPDKFILHQNYPNPFNPLTTIDYEIQQPGRVKLEIYNTLGQLIRKLVDEEKLAGNYSVFWDGKNDYNELVTSGTYFYRIINGNLVSEKKMLLLR